MFRASRSVVSAALTTLVPLAVIGLAGCSSTSERRSAEGTRAEVSALFNRYIEALNRSDSTGIVAAGVGPEHLPRGHPRSLPH